MSDLKPATRQRITTRAVTVGEMTRIALFTTMAAAAAILARFGGSIVPFSLVPFVVCLAGGILGPRSGAYSMLVYMLLGLIGIPVFASPPYGGFTYVMTPTFGFVPGFVLAAYIVGSILERAKKRNPRSKTLAAYIVANVAGILVYYSIGIPYLALILNLHLGQSTSLGRALQLGFLPFAIPDLVKALVAAFVSRAVVRARIPL